ncbi:hypothetical protein [Parabacteroides bouchesdurhonensis]|uniref:hypothetical protein n=1 Tax=Parabacteroides bouchesdurhonensis TaxID=1936995 RepID=UPI00164E0991|nr:hypothetical protein [Parabacteroides bouchesdurhonensis]
MQHEAFRLVLAVSGVADVDAGGQALHLERHVRGERLLYHAGVFGIHHQAVFVFTSAGGQVGIRRVGHGGAVDIRLLQLLVGVEVVRLVEVVRRVGNGHDDALEAGPLAEDEVASITVGGIRTGDVLYRHAVLLERQGGHVEHVALEGHEVFVRLLGRIDVERQAVDGLLRQLRSKRVAQSAGGSAAVAESYLKSGSAVVIRRLPSSSNHILRASPED